MMKEVLSKIRVFSRQDQRKRGVRRRGVMLGVGGLLIAIAAYALTGIFYSEDVEIASVRFPGGEENIHLGDSLQYAVTVTAPFPYWPSSDLNVSAPMGLQSLDQTPPRPVGLGWGSLQWKYVVRLQPYRLIKDESAVVTATLKHLWRPGETKKVQTSLSPISVEPSLDGSEGMRPPLVARQIRLAADTQPFYSRFFILIVSVLVIAVMGAVLFLRYVNKRMREDGQYQLSPAEKARQELSILSGQLPMSENRFFVKLVDILRIYVEETFAYPATRATTAECLRQLQDCPAWGERQRETMGAVLREADLVKFGDQRVSQERLQWSIGQAECLVTATADINAEQDGQEPSGHPSTAQMT